MSEADNADARHLAARDELLQVMYWLRGEGIAEDVIANDLLRWINLDAMEIHSLLVNLAEAGRHHWSWRHLPFPPYHSGSKGRRPPFCG